MVAVPGVILVKQAKPFSLLMFIAQEPQIPSRQDLHLMLSQQMNLLKAKVGSMLFLIWKRASKTMVPQLHNQKENQQKLIDIYSITNHLWFLILFRIETENIEEFVGRLNNYMLILLDIPYVHQTQPSYQWKTAWQGFGKQSKQHVQYSSKGYKDVQ